MHNVPFRNPVECVFWIIHKIFRKTLLSFWYDFLFKKHLYKKKQFWKTYPENKNKDFLLLSSYFYNACYLIFVYLMSFANVIKHNSVIAPDFSWVFFVFYSVNSQNVICGNLRKNNYVKCFPSKSLLHFIALCNACLRII